MEKNKIANDVKAVSTDVTTEDTRRKLNPTKETFSLKDGKYTGTIKDAFFYADDRAMLKFHLPNNTIFIVPSTVERLEEYPFSQLLSQVNAEYIEDLINLNVNFTIKNNKGKDGETYSNIKRISLVE